MQSGTKSDAIMEGHTADQWSELSDRDSLPRYVRKKHPRVTVLSDIVLSILSV